MLTLNVQVALLPDPSVKVYVTCVVPTLKKFPGACVLPVKETTPELSVAVGSVQVTVVPVTPVLTVSVMSLMHAITGGTVSTAVYKILLKMRCLIVARERLQMWICEGIVLISKEITIEKQFCILRVILCHMGSLVMVVDAPSNTTAKAFHQ